MVDHPDPQRYSQKRGLLRVLLIAWAIWLACAAYSYWSYNRVFPLFAPIAQNGEVLRFELKLLPPDLYDISFAIQYQGDEDVDRDAFAFVQQMTQSNDVQPLHVKLSLTDHNGSHLVQHAGSTEDWNLGTRHAFDETTTFDNFVFLFTHPLEFDAQLFGRYLLEVALTTDNADIAGRQVFVFVSGRREDGYYPIENFFFLAISLVALFIVTLFVSHRIWPPVE